MGKIRTRIIRTDVGYYTILPADNVKAGDKFIVTNKDGKTTIRKVKPKP